MTEQEIKQKIWKILEDMNNNVKVKSNPNGSSANIKECIQKYNYANYLAAIILRDNGYNVKLNEDVKAIDLLGQGYSVEVKTEFYPSNNFFLEIEDRGKSKDYWNLAKTEQVYYAAICGNSKQLHLFDLSAFYKQSSSYSTNDSKYNTKGYLLSRTKAYPFKIATYDLGV